MIMKISWFATGIEEGRLEGFRSDRASTRFRCLIPARAIQAMGHQVNIFQSDALTDPYLLSDDDFGDAVVFIKSFVPIDEILAERARRLDRLVVYDYCDLDFLEPGLMEHRRNMTELAHRCVATAPYLAAAVAEALNVETPTVISDPYEGPGGVPHFSPRDGDLRLLWFGHVNNLQDLFDQVVALADFGREFPLSLNVFSQPVNGIDNAFSRTNEKFSGRLTLRHTPWSLEGTWRALAECDLVIIPSADNEKKMAKSPNRVVESIHNGRFVVANPVDVYWEYSDFILLDTDIVSGLRWAMNHRVEIEDRIRRGQDYVDSRHSPEAIGCDWIKLLQED
jgi:hypothetical protein|tara:strand:+ start:771 stop:1781 length:1011 start_codon:yes stop_codon:yes gene_type:complete